MMITLRVNEIFASKSLEGSGLISVAAKGLDEAVTNGDLYVETPIHIYPGSTSGFCVWEDAEGVWGHCERSGVLTVYLPSNKCHMRIRG